LKLAPPDIVAAYKEGLNGLGSPFGIETNRYEA